MALTGYKNYFSKKDPKNWIEETANLWFRPDGSAKTRAMTQTMIFDAMKRYDIGFSEAASLLEKSILFFTNEHVVGGATAYWEMVKKLALKFNESLEVNVPVGKDFKPGSSTVYAYFNPDSQRYEGFSPSPERTEIFSRGKFPTEKVIVSLDPRGSYWGLWRNGKYEMVFPSKLALKMATGEGEIDEIEENGQKVPVSITPVKNMSESIEGNSTINTNTLFSKLEEVRPDDLRRLLKRSLMSGDFDDDSDFKKEVEDLVKRLSKEKISGKRNGSILSAGQSDYVSRPSSDGPDSEGTGGNA